MFGLGKKKKEKEEKLKNEKDVSKISSVKIKIKVFKSMGGHIDACRAEYEAIEQRNDFGELVSINTSAKHEEDVDFIKESVFREMQVLLSIKSKNKKDAQIDLTKRIRKQERLIFYLNKVPALNAVFNYQDEWAKLRDYRVLKDSLKLDEEGAYFYIDNGVRVYEFISVDGFYIPYWRGSLTYSSYPDHTLRKKVKIREDMKFLQEISGKRIETQLLSFSLILFIVLMLGLGALGFGFMKLYDKNNSASYNQAEQVCMDSSARLNQQYSSVVSESLDLQKYILQKKLEAERVEKNESNIKELVINR